MLEITGLQLWCGDVGAFPFLHYTHTKKKVKEYLSTIFQKSDKQRLAHIHTYTHQNLLQVMNSRADMVYTFTRHLLQETMGGEMRCVVVNFFVCISILSKQKNLFDLFDLA